MATRVGESLHGSLCLVLFSDYDYPFFSLSLAAVQCTPRDCPPRSARRVWLRQEMSTSRRASKGVVLRIQPSGSTVPRALRKGKGSAG